jgi:hypothetical protein
MKMKRIMCRLFGLFFRRATRSKVIAFPRLSRFSEAAGNETLGHGTERTGGFS